MAGQTEMIMKNTASLHGDQRAGGISCGDQYSDLYVNNNTYTGKLCVLFAFLL